LIFSLQFHSFSHKLDEERDTRKLKILSDTQQGHHGLGQPSEMGAGPHQRQHRPSLIDLLTGDHSVGKDSMAKPDNTTTSQPARRGESKNIIFLRTSEGWFPLYLCERFNFIAKCISIQYKILSESSWTKTKRSTGIVYSILAGISFKIVFLGMCTVIP
jgi:hypothetical protein